MQKPSFTLLLMGYRTIYVNYVNLYRLYCSGAQFWMQTALQKPNAFAIGLNISIIVSRRGISINITATVSRTGFSIKLTVTINRIWVVLYGKREITF